MDIDSILNIYKKTYFNLPKSVRSFLGSIYGSIPLEIRFGKQYKIHKELIERFENSDKQFQQDFIFNKTYETLQFAYENISHYTSIFNEHGFRPKDFKSLEDIKEVPYLTKKIIQNNLKNLYTDKIERPIPVQTGGSTFTPTRFFASLNTTRAKERAYTNYIFSRIGFKYRDKTLVLRSTDLSTENTNTYWHYEMVANQLWISANHINNKYIEEIFKEVKHFKPKFVWGYPHTVSFFVNACKKMGIDHMTGVFGVFLTSEMVFAEQLKGITSFFNCKVISHYGHRESTSIGYRIDQNYYHFLNSYGLTRIVDDELITTSFDNFVMPFINYKTQDYVFGTNEFINKSDVVINIENIEGRLQDFVVTKEGTLRTAMSIGIGHFYEFQNVDAAQYYQDTPGKVTIILESKNPEKVQLKKLIDEVEKHVKYSISFDIKFIDKIEKTPIGKWKTVIQKLDIEKFK